MKSNNFTAEILLLLLFLTLNLTAQNQYNFTPIGEEVAEKRADSVLALMNLDEKLLYIGGYNSFFIAPIERLNLPSVFFSDATQGINIRTEAGGVDISDIALKKSTAFPAPIGLAATWNADLAKEYARAVGEECVAGGIGVLLGPGMNIYRISRCGRNFEYFGEDPFLAAKMIENYVIGLQSTGTVATLKHFVTNNTEFLRRTSNSVVSERALHEIYMPAFKAGIDAGARAVMTSYNLVNGEWAGQSKYVISELLRNRLNFKWLTMTDWGSVNDGKKLIESGMDLEMPQSEATQDVRELLEKGYLTEKQIDRMVISILKTCFSFRLYERKADKSFYNKFPDHVKTALKTSREGIVLLKNDNILPIKDKNKKILLTGDYVEEIPEGGGAAKVDGYDRVNLLNAVKAEFGDQMIYIKNPTAEQIKNADIVFCNIGMLVTEGYDQPFKLRETQLERVQECVNNNPNTIVIVTTGSGVKMTGWHAKAAAILFTWYPGQIGNVAIAEVLSGKVNPSGKLPITIEKEFEDSPGYDYMKSVNFYYDDSTMGENITNEQHLYPLYDVNYNEGVFVGYRWYEKEKIEPLFPFGFGLSYTTFDYSEIKVSKEKFNENENLTVTIKIKNTGETAGAEAAQLYISDSESSVPRPVKELKGIKKVNLNPGESRAVTFEIDKKDFSFWDPDLKEWSAEKGEFIIMVGSSSSQIHLKKSVEMI